MKKATATATATAVNNVDALLEKANESAQTADKFARQAAEIAAQEEALDVKDKAERIAAILAAHKDRLVHKAVKESFSAALAILIADAPVRIAASAVTEKASGGLSFTAPDVLTDGETAEPKKIVKELAPQEALARLPVGVMKQAATAARETLGIARAKGAGRKAKEAPKRAPFFDELIAVIRDAALRRQALEMFVTAAKTDAAIKKDLQEAAKAAAAK